MPDRTAWRSFIARVCCKIDGDRKAANAEKRERRHAKRERRE